MTLLLALDTLTLCSSSLMLSGAGRDTHLSPTTRATYRAPDPPPYCRARHTTTDAVADGHCVPGYSPETTRLFGFGVIPWSSY